MTLRGVREYFEEIARKGGPARAKKLSEKERKEARRAAQARWAKAKKKSQ